jgi:hypothetical protein
VPTICPRLLYTVTVALDKQAVAWCIGLGNAALRSVFYHIV